MHQGLARVRWALGFGLAACTASQPPAGTPAALRDSAPVALGAPSPAADAHEACAAAGRRFRAELSAASEGCLSDEGCEPFATCNAVVRGRAPALWARRSETEDLCRRVGITAIDVECGARPTRCVARRCIRF